MSQICENKENKEQEPMRTIYYNDAFEDDYEDHSSSICSIISDDYTFDNSDYDDTGFEEEMTSKKISIVDTIIETEKKIKYEKIKEEYERTKYKQKLETEEEILLAKRLCWLDKNYEQNIINEELNNTEYPFLNTVFEKKENKENKENKEKKERIKFSKTKWVPFDIQIVIKPAPSTNTINFYKPEEKLTLTHRICKYVLEKKECPFKDNCKFIHYLNNEEKINKLCKFISENKECPFGEFCKFNHYSEERKLCKYVEDGKECKNKVCRFLHSNLLLPIPQKNKKIWYCKNLIQTGKCRFGENCIYAHSFEEVKNQVIECKFGIRCNAIKKIKGVYHNNGDRKCIRLHEDEDIKNFVTRTQE